MPKKDFRIDYNKTIKKGLVYGLALHFCSELGDYIFSEISFDFHLGKLLLSIVIGVLLTFLIFPAWITTKNEN